MARFKVSNLASLMALVVLAFVGTSSATASEKSIDAGTSLTVGLFGAEDTIKCNNGDMKVTGPIGMGGDGFAYSTTFSGCTSTSSNFPTTVEMKGCYFSMNEALILTEGGLGAYPLFYINCPSGGQITFTSYLNKTKLCTVALDTNQTGIVGETEDTAPGYRFFADSQAEPNLNSGWPTSFLYTAQGAYCPEKGGLSGATLRVALDMEVS